MTHDLRKVAPGAIALIGLGQSVSGWQSAWIGGAMMIGGGLWIATNVFGPAVLRRLPFEIRVSRRPKLDPLKKPFGGTPDDYAEVAAAALLLANEIAAYADAAPSLVGRGSRMTTPATPSLSTTSSIGFAHWTYSRRRQDGASYRLITVRVWSAPI